MTTRTSLQSSLAMEITRYISLKQALGRRFDTASHTLLRLDRFLCTLGKPSSELTSESFKQWCKTMKHLNSNTALARMRVVRNFCLYRQRTRPDCFVPDRTQFPQAGPTVKPYIFSDVEVGRLLYYCDEIVDSPQSPLRGAATRLAILLLFTTGVRRGELLRLTLRDYDPAAQTLLIRTSKFQKSRLLPLPDDVGAEVARFLKTRSTVRPPAEALLGNPHCGGRAYSATQLRKNVQIVLNLAGIKKPDGSLPRIHDFRFSFAVNALIRWYRAGVDVQSKLPFLAAYMGHVSVLSIYHYLRFIEPLRALASRRFADSYGGLVMPTPVQKGGRR